VPFYPTKIIAFWLAYALKFCPSYYGFQTTCEVHPLVIEVRGSLRTGLYAIGRKGRFNISLIDIGNRFRLVVMKVESPLKPTGDLPKITRCASFMGSKTKFKNRGYQTWILAGGASSYCFYSQAITTEFMEGFCRYCWD